MTAFLGILSIFLCMAWFGLAWVSDASRTLSAALLEAMVKSIWLSWILVGAFYLFGGVSSLVIWAVALFSIPIVALSNRHRKIFVTAADVAGLLTISLMCAAGVASGVISRNFGYTPIFYEWDALVSWNKWAVELANGHYKPYNAAYPILFPGLWSMVYRAQGTSDVWIIAKLTLFALPLIALLVPLILWQSGQRMASLILLLFAVAFATDAHMHSLLSGLMDGPMALMALAFAGWAVVTVYSVDRHENSSNLVLLATLAGICAVTKQAGFLVLPTFYSILILFFVHRKINPWTAIVSATVAAIPLALFGAIFISVSRQPFGNLSYLSDLAWKDRGYWTQLLYSGQLLEAEVSSSVLFILCASSLLNFFNMRRLPGQVGVIFLVFASVGFVVFANCCSYEARNGWWVISLLAGSAAFGCTIIYQGKMSYCWTSIPALAVPISLLFVAISTAALVGASYSDRSLNSVQSAEQWRSVSPGLSKLLKEQKDRFVSGAVLISPDRPVGWLPGLRDHYTACSFDRPDCIIDAVSSADTAYILISDIPVLDYAYLRPILPPELLIGVADGFSLYGPVTKPMLHGLAGRYVSDGQLSERQAPPN